LPPAGSGSITRQLVAFENVDAARKFDFIEIGLVAAA
jgi:hypothetical protein